MAKLKLGIILGSTRPKRVSEKVGAWVAQLARSRAEFDVTVLDLRDFPLPFYEEPLPAKAAEATYGEGAKRNWANAVAAQDAFIFVTPEYNHGYSAVLKNALDHVYVGWNGKPVAYVSYGGVSGGIRAVQQLRQVSVELQLVPMRDEVNIAMVGAALDEHCVPKDPVFEKRANIMLDRLTSYGEALRGVRPH